MAAGGESGVESQSVAFETCPATFSRSVAGGARGLVEELLAERKQEGEETWWQSARLGGGAAGRRSKLGLTEELLPAERGWCRR